MLILLLGSAIPWTVSAQAPQGGAASAPLALQVSCELTGQAPVLRVQLVNTSEKAMSVVVGFNADGKTQIVNSFDVIAIRPATGADEIYAYVHPKYATAKGTPWVVALPPRGTHTIDVLMRDFISTMTYTGLDPVVASGTRLIFEARPAAKGSAPVWTGKVETRIGSCGQ
jgi:hypothetical protein